MSYVDLQQFAKPKQEVNLMSKENKSTEAPLVNSHELFIIFISLKQRIVPLIKYISISNSS